MTIKNVVFDFGGVLLDWNPRYAFRQIFNDDERMEHFLATVCTSEWNAQMDAGKPFAQGVAELSAQHPEFKREIALYWEKWPDMLRGTIDEGMRLLEAVKSSGKYTIYGLTNWSAETFPQAFAKFPFLNDFEGIVVSGEEKMAKPDKRIYMVLLERYHLKGEECLYLDDNEANVAMAINRGLEAVRFGPDRAQSARDIAARLGLDLK
ncbi:MAG: HAD family phosphatase [Succinivibrionaceae bacterium]|nr:HAD family phosphatase [Succinivibrionaceae bacterium]